MDQYFVMIHTASGDLLPLMNENDNGAVAVFNSAEEAKTEGEATLLGGEYGCSVFDVSESV